MTSPCIDKDAVPLPCQKKAHQGDEALLLLVAASLRFAHIPLLPRIIASTGMLKKCIKYGLACFEFMLLFIYIHPAHTFTSVYTTPQKLSVEDATNVTNVSLRRGDSAMRFTLENHQAVRNFIAVMHDTSISSTGKVSFYAAMMPQSELTVTIADVPSGTESNILASLAKDYLTGLVFFVVKRDVHIRKVRKKQEKLASPVHTRWVIYHVYEIISLHNDALRRGWLVSGISPPETGEPDKGAAELEYPSAIDMNEDMTPFAMEVILLIIFVGAAYVWQRFPPSPLIGPIEVRREKNIGESIDDSHHRNEVSLEHTGDLLNGTVQKVRIPRGQSREGWYLLRYMDYGGICQYALQLVNKVKPDELSLAVLHIRIGAENVPECAVTLYTTVDVYSITSSRYLSTTYIACTDQEILIRDGELQDRLNIQLSCRNVW